MPELSRTRVYRLRLFRWGIALEVEGEPFDPVAIVAEALAELADTPDDEAEPYQSDTEQHTPVVISDHEAEHLIWHSEEP